MAKILALIAAFVATIAVASTIPQDGRVAADRTLLNKQQTIIKLLHRVHQPNQYQDLAEIGNSYDIEQNFEKYQNVEVVKQFMKHYRQGFLPRGKVFSILFEEQREEMINLFEVLLTAKDYDTFIKTACWARNRINEGQFIYALTTAVLHRQDTKDVVLPPTYEIQPHFFLSNYVIKQAYEAKMRRENALIEVNNTKFIRNADQEVAYFSEDIGLNQFYSNWNKDLPFWFKREYGTEQERKGELFYYLHQQLLARYDFERISNDLPTIEPFHFRKTIKHGYAPRLSYRNGVDFPVRPDDLHLQDLDTLKIKEVQDYERRVRDSIDLGYVITEEDNHVPINDEKGINILGKIIGASLYDTSDYYGFIKNMYQSLVGHVIDPLHKYGVPPSVLEHFETVVRDPVFYSIQKRIYNLVQKYKEQLPTYTKEQLYIPGLKVENVEVDKLITYFEDYDVDLTNAIDVNTENYQDSEEVTIKARTKRINHKPFNLKVELDSDVAKTVLVRVFVGPKYNYLGQEIPLEKQRQYMVELDKFPVQVEAGKNVIERHSRDFNTIVPDQYSYKNLKKMVEGALEDKNQFYTQKQKVHCGFPERLLIPKGKVNGLPVTLFIMVSNFEENVDASIYQEPFIYCGTEEHKYPDSKPMGYPFDRQIYDEEEFHVPNVYFKDVLIYHKREGSDVTRNENL